MAPPTLTVPATTTASAPTAAPGLGSGGSPCPRTSFLAAALPADTLQALFQALVFASEKHSTQRRKDPEQTPYINHPIGVASFLVEAGVTDAVTLQAALLHDTIEDTDTSAAEIQDHFGEAVCRVVLECTDDMSLPADERKRRQVLAAATASSQAKLVKLADKLHNLQDLRRAVPVGWTADRVQAYYAWAKRVTDGCTGTSAVLEGRLQDLFDHGTFTWRGREYKCLVV
ncbi:Guanosine-3',5'-bis(diphosphate) 3'-pyrophosphohydrolase MESH1 [Tieghemiomyces parasiticus]|uniref:Guanosine-3',5'-bis(diphosphate) 3'-pyrophosphohydrolase MESH1 n=1 Tax=Tieghemiomyces parasiticus TaxID=78921 RepID=A0A9W8A273_9FUNG|nr:Guanosine-3',5'-bis(diphosphate) 3'-pyrophosphohydrolase MESH1 [Tieghemiomyces parasiticus]